MNCKVSFWLTSTHKTSLSHFHAKSTVSKYKIACMHDLIWALLTCCCYSLNFECSHVKCFISGHVGWDSTIWLDWETCLVSTLAISHLSACVLVLSEKCSFLHLFNKTNPIIPGGISFHFFFVWPSLDILARSQCFKISGGTLCRISIPLHIVSTVV